MTFREAHINLTPTNPEWETHVATAWPTQSRPPSERPHHLRLIASNGTVLAHSGPYPTRAQARRAAHSWIRAMEDITHQPDLSSAIREEATTSIPPQEDTHES